MRQRYIYFGIFSFIMFGSFFAKQASDLRYKENYLEAYSHAKNIASARVLNPEVLGTTISVDENNVVLKSNKRVKALDLLMEEHAVTVMFKEDGAEITSINGIRTTDNENKVWKMRVNDVAITTTADKYFLNKNDIVSWSLE